MHEHPVFGQSESDQPITIHIAANDFFLKIVKNYFCSDPYQNEFGVFLKHLINDPILINKTVKKKPTPVFSFSGEYKDYSPFNFLADKIIFVGANYSVPLLMSED
jgi:hypothetical protein